jgi:hypothetical protein
MGMDISAGKLGHFLTMFLLMYNFCYYYQLGYIHYYSDSSHQFHFLYTMVDMSMEFFDMLEHSLTTHQWAVMVYFSSTS